MTISIHITGENPDQLRDMLASLAAAMGGGYTMAAKLEAAEVAPDEKSATLVINSPVAADPPPPPDSTPDDAAPDTSIMAFVQANVIKELTPNEMRSKGSDMLMMLYNRDPDSIGGLNALRTKYGVKKFSDVADDQAKAFYTDAMLLANGTGEVAA